MIPCKSFLSFPFSSFPCCSQVFSARRSVLNPIIIRNKYKWPCSRDLNAFISSFLFLATMAPCKFFTQHVNNKRAKLCKLYVSYTMSKIRHLCPADFRKVPWLGALRLGTSSCWFWHFLISIWTWLSSFRLLAMVFCTTGRTSPFWVLLRRMSLGWTLPMVWTVQSASVICLAITIGIWRARIRGLWFWAAFTDRSCLMVYTAHYLAISLRPLSRYTSSSAVEIWQKKKKRSSPLELFLPIPSLSTTSSLHLIWRFGILSLLIPEEVELSSPLSLRVPEMRIADWLSGTCRTWELDAAADGTWRVRDIMTCDYDVLRFIIGMFRFVSQMEYLLDKRKRKCSPPSAPQKKKIQKSGTYLPWSRLPVPHQSSHRLCRIWWNEWPEVMMP